MQSSPKLHGKHAWALRGVDLIEGEISGVDEQNDTLTLHCNDGKFRTFPRASVALDVESARELNMRAMTRLHCNLTHLDRQGAPLQQAALPDEKYGRVSI